MSKTTTLAVIILLAAAIILPRFFDLGAFQAADEKRWLSNTVGFTMNLATGDWAHLMLQPHPGITTQWFAAPTVFSDSWAIRKLPLALAQSILVGLIGYVFFRLAGAKLAVLLTLLLALNPLLIAHTRVLAMDSLLAQFLILSLGLLLLWRKTTTTRYLILAGAAAAAAILSKIPGLIIIPFSLGLLIWWQWKNLKAENWKLKIRPLLVWTVALIIGLTLILPSLVIAPTAVITDIATWLQSDDYQLHQINNWYYLRTLIFFSTPLHLLAIIALPFVWRTTNQQQKQLVITFFIFALLFTIGMSLGAKKGDRYLLPAIITLDIVAATIVSSIGPRPRKQNLENIGRPAAGGVGSEGAKVFSRFSFPGPDTIAKLSLTILVAIITWQAIIVFQLHPHTLAYINPITKPFFGDQRHGWGEGLDLAATYLNQKPNAGDLKVAAYYPSEFGVNFKGETVPLHNHENPKVNYAVLYRAMFDRGQHAWETDVLNHYQQKKPEKVIQLSDLDFVWIYSTGTTQK